MNYHSFLKYGPEPTVVIVARLFFWGLALDLPKDYNLY
jgi:hypothetical protein